MVAGGGRGRGRLQRHGGLAQHRDRRVVPGAGGLLDVVRALDRPRPPPREPLRRSPVRAEPPPTRGRFVDRVPHHRMAEREPPRSAASPDEAAEKKVVERREGRAVSQLGHLRRQVDVEGVADDRRCLQQPPRVRSQPAQLRRQRRRDGRRHGPVAARGNSVLAGSADQLLEVERVAAAVGVDGVGARGDELARLQRAQRPHPDHRRALERELAGAGREREQDAARRRPVDQRQQRLARGWVGPVDVVEADDQRPRSRQLLQPRAQPTVGPVAVVTGEPLAQRLGP